MTEILSKAQVIVWSCGLASEAVVIMAANLVRGSFVYFNLNTKIGNPDVIFLFFNFFLPVQWVNIFHNFFYRFPP